MITNRSSSYTTIQWFSCGSDQAVKNKPLLQIKSIEVATILELFEWLALESSIHDHDSCHAQGRVKIRSWSISCFGRNSEIKLTMNWSLMCIFFLHECFIGKWRQCNRYNGEALDECKCKWNPENNAKELLWKVIECLIWIYISRYLRRARAI